MQYIIFKYLELHFIYFKYNNKRHQISFYFKANFFITFLKFILLKKNFNCKAIH